MKVPFFDLKRQYNLLENEIETSVCDILKSGEYIEGAMVKNFEKHMAEYLGVKHVITCGNGTDALRLALQAVGVRPGDEVITTDFSFYATAEAITELGAVPFFADVNKDDYNIDVNCIKKLISDKTKAILPVHIFGLPANMDEINQISKEYGIPVVEDACQGIGATYKGKKTGALGDVGCFSFYPTKNLGAAGDGGMAVTDSDVYANAIRALKAHGAGMPGKEAYEYLKKEKVNLEFEKVKDASYNPYKYYNFLSGWNSRLDSVQAAVLMVKLKHLDEFNQRRFAIAKKYVDALRDYPVCLPIIEDRNRISCCHQFAIYTDGPREKLQGFLKERGIETGNFYPVALHSQYVYQGTKIGKADCPVSDELCKKTVCLPVFPELEDEEVNEIIRCCKEYFS